LRGATGCARCHEPATTVVIGFSAVTAYVDLCERHLADLLRGARPAEPAGSAVPEPRSAVTAPTRRIDDLSMT
jgi:hypothetical protein